MRNAARGGGCFESFKLSLSFTTRNWHQIFNLIILFLYTNLFLFCEKKYIHIVFLKFSFRSLTLNAPIATKVVCFSPLLKCLRSLYGKQCEPRSDCSYRSSLYWVHAVCFYTEFVSNVLGPRCLLLYLICY